MKNTVWQGFLGFHVALVIKRLLRIELRAFRKKEKKGLEVPKLPREATTNFRVWVILCRIRVLKLGVATVGIDVATCLVWARRGAHDSHARQLALD